MPWLKKRADAGVGILKPAVVKNFHPTVSPILQPHSHPLLHSCSGFLPHQSLVPTMAATRHEHDVEEPREDQPLLKAPDEQNWTHPRGFIWIELAIFANVFLYGFDGTITAATYAVISSDFNAANTASWLTTAYLVTSTAFQPLYGRFSDIFGRRVCFFVSTITFAIGCFGCGLARNIIIMNCMRALTGFGGGGLMTMGECIPKSEVGGDTRGHFQDLGGVT